MFKREFKSLTTLHTVYKKEESTLRDVTSLLYVDSVRNYQIECKAIHAKIILLQCRETNCTFLLAYTRVCFSINHTGSSFITVN